MGKLNVESATLKKYKRNPLCLRYGGFGNYERVIEDVNKILTVIELKNIFEDNYSEFLKQDTIYSPIFALVIFLILCLCVSPIIIYKAKDNPNFIQEGINLNHTASQSLNKNENFMDRFHGIEFIGLPFLFTTPIYLVIKCFYYWR